MPERDPESGQPSSEEASRRYLKELLDTLREFSGSFSKIEHQVERLPPPLSAAPLVSLRHAEELRHGTDHLIHALSRPDNACFGADQLRDAGGHLENLLPDLYMHICGYFLRWCADALSETGLVGQKTTHEKELTGLISAYAEARILRTGDRHRAVRTLKEVFDGVIELAPQILSITEERQRGSARNITILQSRVTSDRNWLIAALVTFAAGVFVWIW